jgi:outer membrane protein OmpA-like peptidoglycan-associated protein
MARHMINLGAIVGVIAALAASSSTAQSVKVTVAAVPNPIAAGGCTRIWADVRDSLNRQLTFENGAPLQWSSYDYSSSNGTDFEWRSTASGESELCAKAAAGAVSTEVVATIKGMTYSGTTQVSVAAPGATAPQVASAVAPATPPATSQPAAAAPTVPAQPYVAPPAYAPPPAQATAPAVPPSQTYAANPPAAPPPAAAPTPPQQAQPQPVKSGGGFFKKLGSHLKERAAAAKAETAQNLTAAATQVVDTAFQTGSKLVSSTAAEASNTARMGIGGVGRQLMLAPQRGGTNADNLALAIASGRAVLLEMRFAPNSDVLEPAGRELAGRVAAELRQAMAANPTVQFVIEGHVEPGPNAQVLSELRAGAVKAALLSGGVDGRRLIALGYGDSRPLEAGGPPVARIEVARAQ